MNTEASPKPLLIYDGECGFCNYSIRYWEKLTGGRVDYEPYQQAASRFPDIPLEEFKRAIWYIAPDGSRSRAAEASFRTLSHAKGRGFLLKLYRHLPGFKWVSEKAYTFVAAHRPAFHRISRVLWGKERQPAHYDLVTALFLRLLGFIFLAAFASFGVQALALIGSEGILPVQDMKDMLENHLGGDRYFVRPMIFWWSASDAAISSVCWGGVALSILLIFNFMPWLCLLFLYLLYLSLINAGQIFMNYQWDAFLVETGFLALLLAISKTHGIWLLRWLLFRFMFMSGAVKLLSEDPSWADWSALSYHFLTQPLPTPLAWYAAQIPNSILAMATGLVFFVELVLPFLIFAPRHLRFFAAAGFLLLEFCIFLTGNYNFFNLHTALLCLLLFDDAALRNVLPRRLAALLWKDSHTPAAEKRPPRALSRAMGVVAVLLVSCSLVQICARFGNTPPFVARALHDSIAPFRIVNSYGLFAVMTTVRREIVFEGSNDGETWKEYEFRYKPGNVKHAPPWNIPHQPRVDWQMWFAALESPDRLVWFWRFIRQTLDGSPPVLGLFAHNPFPDGPPLLLRAKFYEYTFSLPEEKARGIWWNRRLLGLYFPVASLKPLPKKEEPVEKKPEDE